MEHNTELLNGFIDFYNDYHRQDIGELAQSYPKDRKSLRVDYGNLHSFSPNLADDLRNKPETVLGHAETALGKVDIPVDIDLSGATVRVYNLDDAHIYGVGEIRSEHRGKYLGVFGHISRVTGVKPKVTEAAFECQRCGNHTTIPQESDEFQEPHECHGCERQGPFRMDMELSEFTDRRKLQLKQPPEDSSNGEGDTITVYLEGEIADPPNVDLESRVGEDAVIYGHLDLSQQGNSRNKSPVFDRQLIGRDFEFERSTDEIDVQEHKPEFTDAANQPDAYQRFIDSMAPDIYPYGRWPLALRLGAAYLMGGARVSPKNGSTYRGDIHMAIVGPPGVGKSKFSQNIAELSPGSEHRSATGLSSDVGLTAAAVQDDFADGDGWVLKPGILPRAKHHAILDEADKTGADLSKMNDALEGEQMASIDKGGINAKLKTRVGLLAMANPDGGRWDGDAGIKEQVNMDESLWSRFDGIVLLEDQPDKSQDSELAEHVLENYNVNLARQKHETESESESDVPVSWDAMKAWVKYARDMDDPELTETAKELLQDYYVEIRNDESFAENSHPTARKLEAGIRFATGYARIRLSEHVEECDARMAIDLSKELLGQSLNGGELDADVFTEAEEQSQKNRKERVYEYVRDNGEVREEEVIEEVPGDESRLRDDIAKLKRKGEFMMPETGMLRVT